MIAGEIDAGFGRGRPGQGSQVVGDEVLYVLCDTPGMQRSREVLAWLQAHGGNASSRSRTVRRFLEEHL